ncbi:serine/threonine-protein kinase atr-like [Tachypleus tridentatus]|uniref:serine/threonine-protein kinase atr-like n=1 Tax=Tachypleus tridentatus TaxID=6853 RepID=UPI003FD362F3
MNLNEYFHDLYFIPELAELTEVNTVLKEYIDRPSKQADFHSLLSHSLKGVSHENLEVCFHALRKVKQLLCSHQSELLQYLLEQESADPLISQLMSVIISRCRETDPIIRLALAECIGELGAIDNGRLEMRRLSENQKSSFFYLSVEDENFAYDLVQELVRSFLAAEDTRIQDCASYALQETLQIYTCQSGELSQIVRPSGSLWNRFSEEVQEILVPLQHSRYIMSSNKRTSFPCPIYGSKLGSTFKDWACNWASCLLQKIKRENTARVFQSCFMIVKNDVKTTVFLLPHIMVNVLQDASNEEKEDIYREIMAVLSHVDQAEQSKLKFHEKTDLCHLSAQTVFSILDCLTVWCHQYFVMLRSSNQNNSKPANKGKETVHPP